MEYVYSTETDHVYVGYDEDHPVHFYADRVTGEIRINMDDMARCFGFRNLQDMLLSDDKNLDKFLEIYQKHQARRSE